MIESAPTGQEEGSIVILMMVVFVTTILVASLLLTVTSQLAFSRRAGNSANALQLADAGLNDALRTLPSEDGPSYSTLSAVALGNGSYYYTATLDPSASVWHVSSWGKDQSGVERKVEADAQGASLYSSAVFVYNSISLGQGTLDSFSNGDTLADMCTGNGVLASNQGGTWFGTNGNGNGNCGGLGYSVDRCVLYSNNASAAPPTTGSGQCPPSNTTVVTPQTPSYQVTLTGLTPTTQPHVCDGSNGASSSLTAQANGLPYYWTSVTLRPGCHVDPSNGPVTIYSAGPIDIGAANGNSGAVNQPNSGSCSALPYPNYCPGWSGNLRLYVTSGASNPTITLDNHVQFWGIITAPTGCIDCGSHGNPQAEVWGAILVDNFNSNAKLSLHYDDHLKTLTSGRYTLLNWREEPLLSSDPRF